MMPFEVTTRSRGVLITYVPSFVWVHKVSCSGMTKVLGSWQGSLLHCNEYRGQEEEPALFCRTVTRTKKIAPARLGKQVGKLHEYFVKPFALAVLMAMTPM